MGASVFEWLCATLRNHFNYDDIITSDMNIRNDLGADSLDMLELILKVENSFNISISISDEDWEKIVTVGDLVKLIESLTEGEL